MGKRIVALFSTLIFLFSAMIWAAVLDQPKGGFCSGGEPAKHLYAGGFAKPWDDL